MIYKHEPYKKTKKTHSFLIVLPPESTETLTWNNSQPVYFQELLFF